MHQAGLTAIRMVPGDPVLWLKLAKDARWLSHHAAVEALHRSFVSILTSFDRKASERSERTASGLLNFTALSFFADILPHLSELSRTLQSSSFPNADIHSFSFFYFQSHSTPHQKLNFFIMMTVLLARHSIGPLAINSEDAQEEWKNFCHNQTWT